MDNEYMHEMMKKLLDQSEETQKTVVSLDKKVDLHIQKTELQLSQIHKLDEQQNSILDEHHKRSDALAKDNELRERALRLDIEKATDRLEAKIETKVATAASKEEIRALAAKLSEVELPQQTFRNFLKVATYIATGVGVITGAIYGIYQILSIYHH